MDGTKLKSFFQNQLESSKKAYVGDLVAMDESMLASKGPDKQRTAYDFSYEIGYLNRRVAARFRGDTPPPWPGEFLIAPEEFRSKDAIVTYVSESFDDLLEAFGKIGNDEMFKEIQTPSGATSPLDLAFFVAYHSGYHDGQLNYIQALHGDSDVHWQD